MITVCVLKIEVSSIGSYMKLSTKLCIYSLLVCLGIFVAIAAVVDLFAARSEIRQAERITRLIQSEIAGDLDSRLYTVEQTVGRISLTLDTLGLQFIQNRSAQILSSILESDSIITGCGIAVVPSPKNGDGEWMEYMKRDSGGGVMMQLGGTGYRYTARQWYADPVKERKSLWSQPYMDTGGGDCLMITFTVPLTEGKDEVAAVITADISLNSLTREIYRLIPYEGGSAFLLTGEGVPLDSWPKDAMALFSGTGITDMPADVGSGHADRTVRIEGTDYICCYTPAPHTDLLICTATPITSIRPVTARIKFPVILIIAIGFISLVIGLRVVIRRYMRPVEKLADAVLQVGDGHFDTEFPDMSGYADMQRLRDAMVAMTKSLKDYISRTEESAKAEALIAGQLEIARRIQRSMLPASGAEIYTGSGSASLKIGAMLESALEVGGDLYDYLANEDRLYFIITDVSGKGIPASLMTAYIKSLFRFAAKQNIEPAELVGIINENMCDNNTDNMFATLIAGRIDTAKRTLTVANAGHNPAVLSTCGETTFLRLPPGLPVGVIAETEYTQKTIPFADGSMIFMYTDGLSEAENRDAEQFGELRLLDVVGGAISAGLDPVRTVERMGEEIKRYSRVPLADDITMLCISSASGSGVELRLSYDIREIARINEAIQGLVENGTIGDDIAGRIALVSEEAVSNIINHSVPGDADDRIVYRIRPDSRNGTAEVTVSDTGPRFNPLEQCPDVDTGLPLEEREVGGLGIFLIRQLGESLVYEFRDGMNILKITIR